MSNIHSVEEAYEYLAEALNYLDEHEEKLVTSRPFGLVYGASGSISWNSVKECWEAKLRR